MADCTKYIASLSALVDGELNEAQTAELHAHMDSCPDCRRVFEAFEALSEAQPRELAAVPADFTANVMRRVKMAENMRKQRKSHVFGYIAAAACVSLVMFGAWKGGFLDFSPRAPEPAENFGVAAGVPDSYIGEQNYGLKLEIEPIDGNTTSGTLPDVAPYNNVVEGGAVTQFGELTRLLNSEFASNEDFVVSETQRLMSATGILVYRGEFIPDDEEFADCAPIIEALDDEDSETLFEMMRAATLLDYDEAAEKELEPFCTLIFTGAAVPDSDETEDIVVVVWIIDGELVFKLDLETPIVFVSDAFPIDFEEFIASLEQ